MKTESTAKAGDRFGKLVLVVQVDPFIDERGRPRKRWQCICDCGKTVNVVLKNLCSGNSKSCGCLKHVGYSTTHGESRLGKWTAEYRAWAGIVQRCTNPTRPYYKNYGGRGIKLCEEWQQFEAFLEYLLRTIGRRPSPKHSIDRIDNDGNYEPGNIRWATSSEQARNRRPEFRTPPAAKRKLVNRDHLASEKSTATSQGNTMEIQSA